MSKPDDPPAVAVAADDDDDVAAVSLVATLLLGVTVAAVAGVPEGSTLIPRSSSLESLPPWGMLFGLTLRD